MPDLVEEIIKQLEKELKELRISVENTIIASKEAPSRMEARYDIRKEDMARLAEAQDERVVEIEQIIAELKGGAAKLIGNYLLISKGGGKKFKTKVGEITLVSKESPLGKKLASQEELLRM